MNLETIKERQVQINSSLQNLRNEFKEVINFIVGEEPEEDSKGIPVPTPNGILDQILESQESTETLVDSLLHQFHRLR